jgi:two-component system phosphate regulon response regulator PhoB
MTGTLKQMARVALPSAQRQFASTLGKADMPHRVLIVEDDADIATMLRYNFDAAGYEVEHIERGDEAEARIASLPPDLLVVDWVLPGLSGIELCRRVRRTHGADRLPIIMLTARTEPNDQAFAKTMGVDYFFTKPFTIGEILARASRLLQAVGGAAVTPAALRVNHG